MTARSTKYLFALILCFAVLLLCVQGWGADKTASTYVLDDVGGDEGWTSSTVDINNVSLDTNSPGQIASSISDMASAAGSRIR